MAYSNAGMSYKAIARRLARLERAYRHWLETRTVDELDALCQRIPADERAAFDALTDAELERLAAGRMSRAEWQRHLHNTRRTHGT